MTRGSRTSRTVNLRIEPKRALPVWDDYPRGVQRPKTRGDCLPGGVNAARPCPFVSCRWHLLLDVHDKHANGIGSLQFNHGHEDPELLERSCALDIADEGGARLETVGAVLAVTRERVRQIELHALKRIRRPIAIAVDEPLPPSSALNPGAATDQVRTCRRVADGGGPIELAPRDPPAALDAEPEDPEDRFVGAAWALGPDGSFPAGSDRRAALRVWFAYMSDTHTRGIEAVHRAPTAAEILAFLEHGTPPPAHVSADLVEQRAAVVRAWRALKEETGRLPKNAELEDRTGISTGMIVHHTSALARDGLVEERRRGRDSSPPPAPTEPSTSTEEEPPMPNRPIAADIVAAIRKLTTSDRGPSASQLAEHFGIEGPTVHAREQAMRMLLQPMRGVSIDWARGRGTFVLDGSGRPSDARPPSRRPPPAPAPSTALAVRGPDAPASVADLDPKVILRAKLERLQAEADRVTRALSVLEEMS